MGQFDEYKARVMREAESGPTVDADQTYTTYRIQVAFDQSPAGQVMRLYVNPEDRTPDTNEPEPTQEQRAKGIDDSITRTEANLNDPSSGMRELQPAPSTIPPAKVLKKGEQDTRAQNIPQGPVDMHSGQPVGQSPVLSFNDIEAAKGQSEVNRQASLQESFKGAQDQPPAGLDALLQALDYPASKVREAIARKISETTGEAVTGDSLAEYVGKKSAPGDPIGQAVNSLITSILTDPLTLLPGLGIPTSAYKKAGELAVKGAETVGAMSKAAGVDMASETGSISTKLLTPQAFYSPTERVIEAKMPNVATPEQVNATLANSGISLDETKWMDLNGFMAGKQTVTKAELLNYVKSHQIEIKEVQLDNKPGVKNVVISRYNPAPGVLAPIEEPGTILTAGNDTKFSNYTLPGGTNYRELLLTLPTKPLSFEEYAAQYRRAAKGIDDQTIRERYPDYLKDPGNDISRDNFKSSHFDQPNILVHIRVNDRVDAEGKRVLFIEEIQSDWGQGARAGKDVPDMPFKKTDQWTGLAIKHVLRKAAEEGYDRIAWTTGAQQAERYDLSKHVGKVEWDGDMLTAYDPAMTKIVIQENHVGAADLEKYIGKEASKKLQEAVPDEDTRTLQGLDLKIGGEGMHAFYDDMLPKTVNKYVKKWGGRVEDISIATTNVKPGSFTEDFLGKPPKGVSTAHSLKFTPAMTEAVLNNPQSLMGGVFQTVDEHLRQLPKIMSQAVRDVKPTKGLEKLSEEGGYFALQPALMITRAAIGALAGSQVGDEENAVRNALLGAGFGAVASPALLKKIMTTIGALKGGAQPAASTSTKTAGKASGQTAQPQIQTAINPAAFQQTYKQLVDNARRGVRHDVDVKAEGDVLAEYGVISQDKVASLYPGSTMNDAETYALHKVLTDSGKQVVDLAAQVTDDATMQEFLKAFYTHGLLLDPKRLGVEAEAGRSLRMYGVDAPVDVQGMKLFLNQFSDVMGTMKEGFSSQKMLEMVKQFQSPEQLANFAKNAIKPQLKDALMSLWVNSLLSGLQTHAANSLGNGATLTWAIAERQLAGLLGGDVHPGEAAAMVKGVFESFGDALALGAKAFMSQESQFGASKLEQTKHISFQDVGVTGIPGQALDYLAAFFQGVGGRPLLAEDDFFKAIAFRAEVRARALREAYAAVSSEGLTGKAASKRVTELTDKYLTDVPADIQKDAEQFAAYVTFTKALGPAGQWLQEGAATIPGVKLIIPFVRTPINIFKFAGERTPFALFTKSMKAELEAGGVRQELALAKISMGAMIAGTGTLWAANGWCTGGGPNPKKFNMDVMKEGGWQAYSCNISAIKRAAKGESSEWQKDDTFVAYNRVEPLGMLLGMYANYVDIVSNADKDQSYDEIGMMLTMATVKTMASKTFIKGLSQTALAFAYPEEFLGDTLNRQAVSFVPIIGSSLSRAVARTVDPVVRQAEGFLEELQKNTPGLSSLLPPKLHPISGEPVYRQGGIGPDIASPLYQSTYKKDSVIEEIIRNKVNISDSPSIVHGVELSQEGKNELHRIITHDVKKGGRNLHDSLEHMMNSAMYKNGSPGSDGRRALLIKSLLNAFREAGEMRLLKAHPEIRQQIKDLQRAHADKMKSVRPLPSDAAIDASDTDLDKLSIAGQ